MAWNSSHEVRDQVSLMLTPAGGLGLAVALGVVFWAAIALLAHLAGLI